MTTLNDCIELLEKYLRKEITRREFADHYYEFFDTFSSTDKQFDLLDWLFAKVDMCTDNENLLKEDPKWHITEDQLRVSVQEVLDDLRKLA